MENKHVKEKKENVYMDAFLQVIFLILNAVNVPKDIFLKKRDVRLNVLKIVYLGNHVIQLMANVLNVLMAIGLQIAQKNVIIDVNLHVNKIVVFAGIVLMVIM